MTSFWVLNKIKHFIIIYKTSNGVFYQTTKLIFMEDTYIWMFCKFVHGTLNVLETIIYQLLLLEDFNHKSFTAHKKFEF